MTRRGKIDVAARGDVVPQFHVHIVARWQTDRLWPKPVFGVTPFRRGDEAAFARVAAAMPGKAWGDGGGIAAGAVLSS